LKVADYLGKEPTAQTLPDRTAIGLASLRLLPRLSGREGNRPPNLPDESRWQSTGKQDVCHIAPNRLPITRGVEQQPDLTFRGP
jgi:hypothetical protein